MIPQEQQKFEKKQKSLYYGIDFTNGLRRVLTNAIGLIYFLSLGFGVIETTSLFSISMIFLIAFEFITGPVADHVSRKLSVIISFVLMGISFLGIFIFTNFWLLALFWILDDIAWTFQSGANTAWIIDTLKYGKHKSNLAKLFSRVYFFEKSGRVIGSLIGLFVIAISFRSIWLVIALANFIMAFFLWKNMEERNFKPDRSNKNLILKTWLKTKQAFLFIFNKKHFEFRGMVIAMVIANLWYVFLYTAVPLVLKETYKLSPDKISGVFILIGVCLLAGPFIGEKSFHRFGARNSLFFGFLLVTILEIVFVLTNSLILAIACLGILEMTMVGTDISFDATIQHKIKSHVRASIGSAMSICWSLAYAAATFFTGFSIVKLGLVPTIWISVGFAFITAFAYRYSIKVKIK